MCDVCGAVCTGHVRAHLQARRLAPSGTRSRVQRHPRCHARAATHTHTHTHTSTHTHTRTHTHLRERLEHSLLGLRRIRALLAAAAAIVLVPQLDLAVPADACAAWHGRRQAHLRLRAHVPVVTESAAGVRCVVSWRGVAWRGGCAVVGARARARHAAQHTHARDTHTRHTRRDAHLCGALGARAGCARQLDVAQPLQQRALARALVAAHHHAGQVDRRLRTCAAPHPEADAQRHARRQRTPDGQTPHT
jgi:hypothetical protein